MKILFLTDNFSPEVNAPATRTFEHCREWVKKGAEVTVITCAPNFPQGKVYEGYKNKLIQKETMDGIKVIRVWSYMVPNKGFAKRIIDYVSYAFAAFITGLFIKTDIIIATSPQFFTAMAGRKLAFWKRKPWIMEVRDLYPDSIKNVKTLNNNLVIKYLEWEEIKCYRKAKAIITVTDTFKKVIMSKGIDKNKIVVIKNGANLDLFKPIVKDQRILSKLKLQNKFIIGYIGTHGFAHKLDFILKVISEVRHPSFHFLFIGDGGEKKDLLELSQKLKLKNVTFLDPVKKLEVPGYLSIIDIALIPLKKSEIYKTVIPSKIFESAAMQKPILLGVDGESKSIIELYHAGLYFEPENKKDLLDKLNTIYEDKELYKELQKGCKKLAIDFDRKKFADRMYRFIEKLLQ